MKKVSFIDVILFVLSAILFFGTIFVFHACPAKDDGSWMVCHWAEHGVIALSSGLFIIALARLFIADSKIKAGFSLAFVPFSVLTALVPGIFINLCRMKDMRCHAVMRPSVIVLSVLLCVLSVIDLIVRQKNKSES